MDLLAQAANFVFSADTDEVMYLPLTPTKGIPLTPSKRERTAFAELTNTINISPEKFGNSPLQALFTAPTLSTPKTKSHNLITISNVVGSRNVGRGSAGKSLSCPSPGSEVGTPKFKGMTPSITKRGGSGTSPLTPMTNLKLLTRIASMEESISTCSKKVLFRKENQGGKLGKVNVTGIVDTRATSTGATALRKYNSECLGRNQCKSHKKSGTTLRKHPTSDSYPTPSSPGNLVLEGIGRIPSVDETASRPLEVSRKDKSLGLLSEKFLEQFPLEVSYLETPRRLVIDEVAAMLGTERRRVYDIINVLESLNMAARVQKNMYQWTGKLQLEDTLGRLKALGVKYDIASKLQALENEGKDFKVPQIKITRIGDCEKTADSRKEKSLSILCQKFIMILLVSPEPYIISLDNAMRLLAGDVGDDGERLRTRGRRLYDIANVLTSLGLVRRVPAAKSFQYIGPAVEAITNDEDTFGILHKNSLLPSRNAIGESKENISTYGNHDVTPSEVPHPVQKRGRPRKLATAFTSALPAPKRSRLQRTHSEDVISHQSRKITRNPSLHDICQVAEVEREKLIRQQQSYRSRSSDGIEKDYRRPTKSCSANKELVLPNIDFRPISSAPSCSSMLQRRLTKRAKIPVALTFEGSQAVDGKGREMVNSHRNQDTSLNPKSGNFKTSYFQKSSSSPCQYPKPLRETRENEPSQKVMRVSTASEFIPDNQLVTNTSIKLVKIVQPICNQSQRNQGDQTRKPIVIVKNNTSSNNSYSQSQMIPTGPSGTKFIEVITKTSTSKDNDGSTVMTVLPASQPLDSTLLKPKHVIRNSSGCFQQVSEGTFLNGQRITISTSSQMGISGNLPSGKNSEAKPINSIPYVVYTVSNNLAGQRTLSRVSSIDATPASSQQHSPLQHLVQAKSWATTPSGLASLTSAPLSQGSSDVKNCAPDRQGHQQHHSPVDSVSVGGFTVNSGSWQPSPDGSSTDSELEKIFGDTFNFSRPKLLIHTNAKN